jgi:putative transposase
MKRARISAEQIVNILLEAEQRPVNEVARVHGVSDAAIYTWRKRFANLEIQDVIRLRMLESKGGHRRNALKNLGAKSTRPP